MSTRWIVCQYVHQYCLNNAKHWAFYTYWKKGGEKGKRERERRKGEAGKHRHTIWYCNLLKAKL